MVCVAASTFHPRLCAAEHIISYTHMLSTGTQSYIKFMPHCWLFPECELNSLDEHSRSLHHKHGTLSLLTLDPALPYRHLNAISKPTFSLILNWRHKRLCIPRRTLWRYTNVVLLLLLLLMVKTYQFTAKFNSNRVIALKSSKNQHHRSIIITKHTL